MPAELLGVVTSHNDWSFEPFVVWPLMLSAVAYTAGVHRLWKRAGIGKGLRRRQVLMFAGGWLILALALVSPLHELGETLFWAHMAQHELLMVAAAPLLVLGRPLVAMLWAVPISWRRSLGALVQRQPIANSWRALSAPIVAWSLHAVVIWVWHLPSLYDAAVTSEFVHALQHTSFIATALLFWWALIERARHRAGAGRSVVYVVTTAAHSGALGALLTFAPVPLYTVYHGAASWGLTALEDQQLAGLIMWIPAGIAYLIAALLLMASWLRQPVEATA